MPPLGSEVDLIEPFRPEAHYRRRWGGWRSAESAGELMGTETEAVFIFVQVHRMPPTISRLTLSSPLPEHHGHRAISRYDASSLSVTTTAERRLRFDQVPVPRRASCLPVCPRLRSTSEYIRLTCLGPVLIHAVVVLTMVGLTFGTVDTYVDLDHGGYRVSGRRHPFVNIRGLTPAPPDRVLLPRLIRLCGVSWVRWRFVHL